MCRHCHHQHLFLHQIVAPSGHSCRTVSLIRWARIQWSLITLNGADWCAPRICSGWDAKKTLHPICSLLWRSVSAGHSNVLWNCCADISRSLELISRYFVRNTFESHINPLLMQANGSLVNREAMENKTCFVFRLHCVGRSLCILQTEYQGSPRTIGASFEQIDLTGEFIVLLRKKANETILIQIVCFRRFRDVAIGHLLMLNSQTQLFRWRNLIKKENSLGRITFTDAWSRTRSLATKSWWLIGLECWNTILFGIGFGTQKEASWETNRFSRNFLSTLCPFLTLPNLCEHLRNLSSSGQIHLQQQRHSRDLAKSLLDLRYFFFFFHFNDQHD